MKRQISLMGGGKILLIVNEDHVSEVLKEKDRRKRFCLQNKSMMFTRPEHARLMVQREEQAA
jgi:hypothetical protein